MKIKIIFAAALILAILALFFTASIRDRYLGVLNGIGGSFSGLFSMFQGAGASFPLNVTIDASSFPTRSFQLKASDLTFEGVCDSAFSFGTQHSDLSGQDCSIKVKSFDGKVDYSSQRFTISGKALRASLNEKSYFPKDKSQISFSIVATQADLGNVIQSFSFSYANGELQKLKSDGSLDQIKFLNSEKLDLSGFSGDMYLNNNTVILFGTANLAKGTDFAFSGK